MTCSARTIRSPSSGWTTARSSPRAPASSSQQPPEPQRHGSLPPVSGMCPNSPAAPAEVRAGYLATLMRFRRPDPPPLLPSTLGDLGALTGASELVFDAFLTPRGLGAWPASEEKTA